MATLSVTNTFVDGNTILAAGHNTNFSDIVTYINNRNDGSSTWDALRVTTSSAVVAIFNNSTGTSDIFRCQDNGTNVLIIADGGALTNDGGAVFNELGADKDFRIEGDTQANLFFVDASTDRIGIGTNTPGQTLHVSGNAQIGSAIAVTTGALQVNGDIHVGGANRVLYNVGNNSLSFGVNNATKMAIASNGDVGINGDVVSNLFYVDASVDEVGIGTTTPTARLHIIPSGASEVGLLVNNGTSTGNIATFQDNGTAAFQITDNSNIVVGSAALATTATDTFLYITSCPGAPTGVPTSFTGRVPLVVDSTNNKLYFYSTGAWRDAGP